MLLGRTNNNSHKNTVIENHATLFDRAEVADLVLANAILIISNQSKLAVTFRIRRNSADKRVATAVNTDNDFVSRASSSVESLLPATRSSSVLIGVSKLSRVGRGSGRWSGPPLAGVAGLYGVGFLRGLVAPPPAYLLSH